MSIPQIAHARKAPPSVAGLPALLAEVFWLMRIVLLFRHLNQLSISLLSEAAQGRGRSVDQANPASPPRASPGQRLPLAFRFCSGALGDHLKGTP